VAAPLVPKPLAALALTAAQLDARAALPGRRARRDGRMDSRARRAE
jgi:hypothetical protein